MHWWTFTAAAVALLGIVALLVPAIIGSGHVVAHGVPDVTPQVGDIGLVRGGGFIGWLIRTVTRSPYAHAFIYLGDGEIVEAEPGVWWPRLRLRLGGARRVKLHYRDVYWCAALSEGLSDVQRRRIAIWAIAHVGTPYSFLDDLSIGFVDLFGRAPGWMRRRLASDRTLMCSQLCVADYRATNRELFPGKPDGAESPADLWRLDAATRAAAVKAPA